MCTDSGKPRNVTCQRARVSIGFRPTLVKSGTPSEKRVTTTTTFHIIKYYYNNNEKNREPPTAVTAVVVVFTAARRASTRSPTKPATMYQVIRSRRVTFSFLTVTYRQTSRSVKFKSGVHPSSVFNETKLQLLLLL